ncbi:MAG TPA: IclR family transcriptional regulator [Solirubrobacteraceae bacterium]|nr:IclR family transcriptional regulator [Solirubrobacteraceae bacterium]
MSAGRAAAPAHGTWGDERAAALVAAVLTRSPRPIAQLGAELSLSEDELRASLAVLAGHELVAVDERAATVSPGRVALRFARSGKGRDDLIELAQPRLRRLAEETGETANLIVPRPGGTEAIAQADGQHLLGVTNWVGRPLGLHCTAAGKVFLAHRTEPMPDGPLVARTSETLTDRTLLQADLDGVLARGYAVLVDELEPGLAAVAAPVRERDGDVVAALCVSGATLRLPRQRLDLLGRLCVEQAGQLSATLGFRE